MREAGKRAEDWDGGRPLSTDEVHYLVKLHAGRAGLKAEKINCHTLRHTAAMRRVERKETVEAVRAFLGRKCEQDTREYLRRLKKKPKRGLRSRKRISAEEKPIPSRGAVPGTAEEPPGVNARADGQIPAGIRVAGGARCGTGRVRSDRPAVAGGVDASDDAE